MSNDVTGLGKAMESFELLTRETREFIFSLIGPAGQEFGLLLGDWMHVARQKALTSIIARAKLKVDEVGGQIHQVPLKVLVPMMESCSLEQDSEMMERWANLLAGAACGEQVLPAHVQILSQLTPEAARVLDRIHKIQKPMSKNPTRAGLEVNSLRESLNLPDTEFRRSLINLLHLRKREIIT
jgi:hypothetical protein